MDMFMIRFIVTAFSLVLGICIGTLVFTITMFAMRGDSTALMLVGFIAVSLLIAGIWHWIASAND